MPYTIKYTDPTKPAVEVFDNTTNSTDTSLKFSGRNTTSYGTAIAENFLHLLENFAGAIKPTSPIEGQLWYNNVDNTLYVNDGSGENGWQTASGVRSGTAQPTTGKAGDIWVDTNNQQIFIYSGSTWILVGPLYSSGSKSGPIVETLIDVDNVKHSVVTMYTEGIAVTIISNATFIPKPSITGFPNGIGVGVTVSAQIAFGNNQFLLPKFNGIATSADALVVSGATVKSSNFLRADTKSSTNYQLSILSNDGLKVGSDGNLALSVTGNTAIIYNNSTNGSVDIRNNDVTGRQVSVLKAVNQRVGINNAAPDYELDVAGTQRVTGVFSVTNDTDATALSSAAVKVTGGIAVSKSVLVGTNLQVLGVTTTANILPSTTGKNIGSSAAKWNAVFAETINATTVNGQFVGNFTGNATTATSLKTPTVFEFTGDIRTTASLSFDGVTGGFSKTFNTELTSSIIATKDSISSTDKADEFLFYRPGTGLRKATRDNMVGDLAVPVGALMPYAGTTAPVGYLLCDGSEVEKDRFPELFVVISSVYGTPLFSSNFKLPDLRGRFALGKDNMDNQRTVAAAGGGSVDAGGGQVNRINNDNARTIGGSGGTEQSSITVDNLPRPNGGGTAVLLPYASGSTAGQLGSSFSVMNPFLTLNYIIRSGKALY
jgi:microcystin-dependent protein